MNNLPISADDLVSAITKTTSALAADMSGKAYLRLHKGGFFVYGADDVEVEEYSKWAVNPNTFALGYVAWPSEGTGKPLGEEMRSITDAPIQMSELPRVAGEWTQQVGMQLMCVSGEDVGVEVVFKASSKGGINGFNDFLNQVLVNLKANSGTDKVVPVIELEVNDYKHPTYGKIYTPVFEIKSWSTMNDMPVSEADDDIEDGSDDDVVIAELPAPEPEVVEEEPAKAPRKKRGKKAEAEPAPEPNTEEAPAPKRRRRRRG